MITVARIDDLYEIPVGICSAKLADDSRHVALFLPDQSEHLGSIFLTAVARFACRPMLIRGDETFCYAWCGNAALTIANRLHAVPSYRPGQCIILHQPNSPEYLASFYGVLLAGGVAVPVPIGADQQFLTDVCRQTESQIILTSTDPSAHIRSDENPTCWLGNLPTLSGPSSMNGPARGPDDLAVVMFTAGSTGSPKGVMLSHRNLISNASAIHDYLSLNYDDRSLCLLPFQHAFGNSIIQSHMIAGGCVVCGPTLSLPQPIMDTAHRHCVTSISAVPSTIQLLFNSGALSQLSIDCLRYLSVAGGALSPGLALQVADAIRPAELFVMYGQTEATARLSYLPPAELPKHPDSIGRGLKNVRLEVVDEDGQPVAPGELGEVRAAGPNIMLGYWRDEQASRAAVRDGWLYTGDCATVDGEGWITLRGRKQGWLKIGGNRVHPQSIENYARDVLQVHQPIVVAFRDDTGTDRLAMFLVDDNIHVANLMAAIRRDLPNYMIPSVVRVVRELPYLPSAKVDRRQLTEIAANEFREIMLPRFDGAP